MISSVLVANRGEIARRIFRTCRDAGIGTVAVHSDADADAPYVAEADAAVRLPGDAAADTYLRADLLVAAALRAGADAVHPGYGFLSENAEFAAAVTAAGLTWIGPPAAAIASMGSKIEAKRLMATADVPVLAELVPDQLTAADLPALLKASAGGGGRGMRVVRTMAERDAMLVAARAEALSAFGDDTVLAEPYLATGRHIEVQILGDRYGGVQVVGERECSIQRRHQKIVEEAPSPLVERTPGMRDRLFDAARRAASAIGYVGAGTVEFLADEEGNFFFLEMNTRLQVEHPVTECTTGEDLVGWQLRLADGARLPDATPTSRGHAIEVRLYAEDPARDWQPQAGALHRFELPGVTVEFATGGTDGVRLDAGVQDGSTVPVYYDPMLAKVIAWGPDRTAVARRLAGVLAGARLHGLTTNRDLLVRVLRQPAFLAGETDTAFLDRHGLSLLAQPLADKDSAELSTLAAALAGAAANRRAPYVPSGWRNVAAHPQSKRYRTASGTCEVRYRFGRDGIEVPGHEGLVLLRCTPDRVVLEVDGVRRDFRVSNHPGLICVDSALGAVTLRPEPRFPDPTVDVVPGSLIAPMPATVVRIVVAVGDPVVAGDPLLVLEAMKMQHTIAAAIAGTVTELPVGTGQQVELGTVLAVVAPQNP